MNWRTRFLWQMVVGVIVCAVAMAQGTNILPNGSFESGQPSFWTAEAGTSGATLTWATDAAKTAPYSLKIEKASTAGAARWVSDNNVRYWVTDIASAVDIKVGAWVKTSGVNTNPASEDAKWQLKFYFYNASGALIGGAPFVLDVDQSVASRDWYADTNAVASLILPETATRYLAAAEAGANATGTVWVDNFIHLGRGGAWAGQNWSGFVDADEGWQYWIAPVGGNDGETYFPGSGVTTEQARTGSYSLKITASPGRPQGELVWISETVPVTPGKKYVLSAWVRTSDIPKDSVFNAESQLGFTVTWHSQLFTDGGGWNEVGGDDYRFTLKDTETGWTQYAAVFTARDNANAVSVRARSWHLWYGTSYWDDFSLNALESPVTSVEQDGPQPINGVIPTEYKLAQNYPNPFNPSTIIEYDLPVESAVKLEVYTITGQKVMTLVDESQHAGKWAVRWDGTDDFGSRVASGLYFYRLATPSQVLTQKMILLK